MSLSDKMHYYTVLDDETGGVMSACGHLITTMWNIPIEALHPLHTTCAGCLRSRHYKRALMRTVEEEMNV